MTQLETPKVVKKKLFSPIWLLPLVALALGAWLGIKSIRESGIEIHIHFPSATGIEIGKTLIKYQGLTVGKVVDISVDDDLKGVDVKAIMDYRSGPFLNENSLFWLVTPKASITGVEGLDALFSGNYIAVQPGDGDSQTKFEASREAPPILPGSDGILVELSSDRLGSLDVGSPLFYRQIPVGSVISYRLEGINRVLISAFIQEQYAHLVKSDSRFWNVSGIKVDASLTGIKVNTESLASILAGGISFNSTANASVAKNGDNFVLFESEELALGGVEFTLVSSTGEGVSRGTPIVYRGITIGEVTDKLLSESGVLLSAQFHPMHSALLSGTARFWLEGADISLTGINHPERLITGAVINFIPGDGDAKAEYELEQTAPLLAAAPNINITLKSDDNAGISEGAQIKFKNFVIGEIKSVALSTDFDHVMYQAEIYPEFQTLLTEGSYFLPESALAIDASLEGVSVKTQDLNTLMKGGVSLISAKSNVQKTDEKSSSYPLFLSEQIAHHYLTNLTVKHVSLVSQDGADITAGSPVYYKKMQIGLVESVNWNSKVTTTGTDDFIVKLAIEKQFATLLKPNSVFWRDSALEVNASLSGVEVNVAPLQGALKGSISLGLLDEDKQGNQERLYESRNLALAQAFSIELTFPASVKLADKAPIRYQGHQIGVIQQVKLNADLETVTASAYLYGNYAHYFSRQDTQFFIVDAQVSLSGITAPETLITGPYVAALPGASKLEARKFVGELMSKTYAHTAKEAVKFKLTSDNLGSVKVGTKIFFRGVAIGQIDGYELNPTGNQVEMYAHIEPEYRHLVNRTSQFWDLSGIKVDLGLFSGAQVETGSLETILAGGVGVVTEHSGDMNNAIDETSAFPLHPKLDEEWLTWTPSLSH